MRRYRLIADHARHRLALLQEFGRLDAPLISVNFNRVLANYSSFGITLLPDEFHRFFADLTHADDVALPDLLDETLVSLHVELNDNIDEDVEKIQDVIAGECLPAGRVFDQEHQLLEGEVCARGVD